MRERVALIGAVLALCAACAAGTPDSPVTVTVTPSRTSAQAPSPGATLPQTASAGPSSSTTGATGPTGPTSSATTACPLPSASTKSTKPAAPTSTAPRTTTPTSRPTPAASPSTPVTRPATVLGVLPTTDKVVALTFDGGGDDGGAAAILATLRCSGVPASFFVTGRFVTAYPTLVADLATVGPVGNHSWDHPHFPTLTDTQVASQLDRTRSAIIAATGKDPIPFFRFPFGDSDGRTRTLVGAQGYQAVGWTVDSLGWKGTSGGMTASKVVDRVVSAARPGEIVLMHLGANPDDHTTLDADALPQIIERLRATGYRFVTLESLR